MSYLCTQGHVPAGRSAPAGPVIGAGVTGVDHLGDGLGGRGVLDTLDGQEAFECDAPRDCPRSDEWGEDNCGHVVCAECHEPLSDHHLAPPLSEL